eukprot:1154350-Pelagomonas_calceolata.AAC.7
MKDWCKEKLLAYVPRHGMYTTSEFACSACPGSRKIAACEDELSSSLSSELRVAANQNQPQQGACVMGGAGLEEHKAGVKTADC